MSKYDVITKYAKCYIRSLSQEELYSVIEKDYQTVSLLDFLTKDEMKKYIDLNILSFYEFYSVADIEVLQYLVDHENFNTENIPFTAVNVLRKYIDGRESFDFLLKNFDKFKSQSLNHYFTDLDIDFTKSDIKKIFELGYGSILSVCDWNDRVINYDDFNYFTKAIYNFIDEDINYFYELYEMIVSTNSMSDFKYSIANQKFYNMIEYEKLLELYKRIEVPNDNLTFLFIEKGWLDVFNDIYDLNYLDYVYAIMMMGDKVDPNNINDFDKSKYMKKAIKYENYSYKLVYHVVSYLEHLNFAHSHLWTKHIK